MSRTDEIFVRLTRATRDADKLYESGVTGGGGTRHWLRDCFLPALENEGLVVEDAACVQELEAALRKIASGPRDTVVTAPDGEPSIVVGDDKEGYAACLDLARAALASQATQG